MQLTSSPAVSDKQNSHGVSADVSGLARSSSASAGPISRAAPGKRCWIRGMSATASASNRSGPSPVIAGRRLVRGQAPCPPASAATDRAGGAHTRCARAGARCRLRVPLSQAPVRVPRLGPGSQLPVTGVDGPQNGVEPQASGGAKVRPADLPEWRSVERGGRPDLRRHRRLASPEIIEHDGYVTRTSRRDARSCDCRYGGRCGCTIVSRSPERAT